MLLKRLTVYPVKISDGRKVCGEVFLWVEIIHNKNYEILEQVLAYRIKDPKQNMYLCLRYVHNDGPS
jgi:hypothetical protein